MSGLLVRLLVLQRGAYGRFEDVLDALAGLRGAFSVGHRADPARGLSATLARNWSEPTGLVLAELSQRRLVAAQVELRADKYNGRETVLPNTRRPPLFDDLERVLADEREAQHVNIRSLVDQWAQILPGV